MCLFSHITVFYLPSTSLLLLLLLLLLWVTITVFVGKKTFQVVSYTMAAQTCARQAQSLAVAQLLDLVQGGKNRCNKGE